MTEKVFSPAQQYLYEIKIDICVTYVKKQPDNIVYFTLPWKSMETIPTAMMKMVT